jgi:2,3-dihydroxybenzoate-AMP ligase
MTGTGTTMKRPGFVPWPDREARRYREAGLWRGEPLGLLTWRWAERDGDAVALVDGDRRLTYRELAVRVDLLAEGLRAAGLRDGDNMLVQLPNGISFVTAFLAGLRAGVAPVMMLPAHRHMEMTAVAAHTSAAALLVPETTRGYNYVALARRVARDVPSVREVIVDRGAGLSELGGWPGDDAEIARRRARLDASGPDPSDVALFLLSGGSTGLPKVITRTHDDYEYNARRSGEVCGFGPDTVYLVALPAGHNFPLGCPGILGTLMAGGRVVLLPSPSPAAVFAAIARENVTVTAAVPAVAARWTEAAERDRPALPSLRMVQVGGSLFTPDAARRLASALGCSVQQVYGMAEGLLNFTRPEDGDAAYTSQGRPMSAYDEIRVVGADDHPVPDGEPGELLTRGPYTPRGYFAVPEHNARAFTADGFFRTGDIVVRRPDGNLAVVGRRKDVINRGGEKIGADEVERLVQALPEVAEAAAVPAPDPVLGERVCVYVLLRPGAAAPALDRVRDLFVAHGVATFKVPERLEVVTELPRTAVGKIDKAVLRTWASEPSPVGAP